MIKRWLIISVTGLILLFLIVACAQSGSQPLAETLNDEEAEALIVDKCSDCHSADRVFQSDYDAEGWSDVIDRMVDRGADVNAADKELMINWLVSRD